MTRSEALQRVVEAAWRHIVDCSEASDLADALSDLDQCEREGLIEHAFKPCTTESTAVLCNNQGCHHVQGHAEPCGQPRERHAR